MKKVRLIDLAFARSGDKGDVANIGVIAHNAEKYKVLEELITPELIKAYYKDWIKGEVNVYPMPNIGAFQIVLNNAIGGGATRTLRLDQTAKSLGQALLRMELEVPDNLDISAKPSIQV